jgi:hypothetical protein
MPTLERYFALLGDLRDFENEKRLELRGASPDQRKELYEAITASRIVRKHLGDVVSEPTKTYRWNGRGTRRTIFDAWAKQAKDKHTQTVISPSGRRTTMPRR